MPKASKSTRISKRTALTVGLAAILLAGAVYAYPAFISWRQASIQRQLNADRLSRINAIYTSLKLSPEYVLVDQHVFGDKRIYEWDKSRSYSSAKTYERNANVDTTAAELRTSIEKAGFKFFDEPYPGSSFTELHFKSAKNEYVRLNVSSKTRDDAFRRRDEAAMNAADPNQGPSTIVIKVNLDDNNE